MPNQKLIAALPLAALFAALCQSHPAAAQQAPQGMVVVRDAQTGQLRAPTADELRALRKAPPAAALAAPQRPALVVRPDGSRQLRIGERGMVYSVVTRGANGKLSRQCVRGADAADAAVEHGTAKEHDDETR